MTRHGAGRRPVTALLGPAVRWLAFALLFAWFVLLLVDESRSVVKEVCTVVLGSAAAVTAAANIPRDPHRPFGRH